MCIYIRYEHTAQYGTPICGIVYYRKDPSQSLTPRSGIHRKRWENWAATYKHLSLLLLHITVIIIAGNMDGPVYIVYVCFYLRSSCVLLRFFLFCLRLSWVHHLSFVWYVLFRFRDTVLWLWCAPVDERGCDRMNHSDNNNNDIQQQKHRMDRFSKQPQTLFFLENSAVRFVCPCSFHQFVHW